MTLRVYFRGPMLFITDKPATNEIDDVVDRVIIPDATTEGFHSDGSFAVRHTVGLLVRRTGQADVHILLAGRNVVITADGEADPPHVNERFLFVPPLHEMTNPEGTLPEHAVRARVSTSEDVTVTIRGGSMSGDLITNTGIEFPQHLKTQTLKRPLCSMPMWWSNANQGQITILEGQKTPIVIDLDATVEAFIYNWDEEKPTAHSLTEPIAVDGAFQDDDFKWVYKVLRTPGTVSWVEWRGTDRFLPAPRSEDYLGVAEIAAAIESTKGAPPNGSTGTCDSSRWRGAPI